MKTIRFLIKAFETYDTVKVTAVVMLVFAILAFVFVCRAQRHEDMGKLTIIIPIMCVVLFASMYMSVTEISNRFVLGVMDNTAATEAELKFRKTFNESEVEFISDSGENYKVGTDKNFTVTIENNELAITDYVADLKANDNAENIALADVIDITEAEFHKYEYYYVKYKTYKIESRDKEKPLITIELDNENYKKLIEYLEEMGD